MKKYTHVKCLKDVIENDVTLFEQGCIYRISEFDYRSLIYYIEIEGGDGLTDEVAVAPNHPDFKFIEEDQQ